MGFLLRRSPARALAGWYDTFDRPNESPVKAPWAFWGNVADFSIVSNRLKLAAETDPARGGTADGGIAYEHQPLTENWGFEFTRAPIGTTSVSSSNETYQTVWIDKNWTEGGAASSTVYQVYLQLQAKYSEDEDDEGNVDKDMDRRVRLMTREKGTGSIFTPPDSTGSDSVTVGAIAWAAALSIRIHVYSDRYMIGWINGYPELLLDLYDPNYRFGPKKRSANFAQISGLVASIDDFKTYDLPVGLRTNWTSEFFDDFNRANGTTVGNGWDQISNGTFGINNNALSMTSSFSGSDGFRQVRRGPFPQDVRIEFVFGGGTGDLTLAIRSAILARMNAAGTKGIAMIAHPRSVTIHGFTWNGSPGTAPSYTGPTQPILAVGTDYVELGHLLSFNIVGDIAWVFNHTLDRLIAFRDGIDALAGSNDGWVGAFIARNAFVNSAPINEIRVLV